MKVLEAIRILDRDGKFAPKVLDADGAEIRVGDVLYRKSDGHMVKVVEVDEKTFTDADDYVRPGEGYTHRAPVLAADGKPLREGETVWSVDTGASYTVKRITDELIPIKCIDTNGLPISLHPPQLTHERPDSWERLEEDAKKLTCDYFGHSADDGSCEECHAYTDSTPQGGRGCRYAQMADLVRRAKALAGGA